MGFFDKMFGGKPDYPQLDPSSPASDCLEKYRSQLESLSAQARQPLEVIPGEERAFVFIGKPPKKFGIAWIEEGQINNLKSLVDQQQVNPQQAQAMAERLREIYEDNLEDERFTSAVGNANVVVTPSDEFRHRVGEVIDQTVH